MEERKGTHQGVQNVHVLSLEGGDVTLRTLPYPTLPTSWTTYEHSNPVGNVGPDQYENRDDLTEPFNSTFSPDANRKTQTNQPIERPVVGHSKCESALNYGNDFIANCIGGKRNDFSPVTLLTEKS
ncbi:hypothetical protein CBL_13792 [Carabus blaptoides fortunei]